MNVSTTGPKAHSRAVTLSGVLFALSAALVPASAVRAEPADYVVTPTIEEGEREIDHKSGTSTYRGAPRQSAASLGFGYGFSSWFFGEMYYKGQNPGRGGWGFDAFEWESKVAIGEPGEYPVDMGVLLEIERPRDRTEGWEVRWGPLLQKDWGRLQANANFLFQRNYRISEPGSTGFLYQWQLRYRNDRSLDFGLQGFGEMGTWNQWVSASERTHRAGPAIFGKVPLGGREAIVFNAAWLIGMTQAAPDHTLRLQVEYEF